MKIIEKIKNTLYHRKNNANYNANLKKYESLMKNKISYDIHQFEVYGEYGVSFNFYTEKLEITYIVWDTEIFNINTDYQNYGQISKFLSKQIQIIANKETRLYGTKIYNLLNKVKSNQVFTNKEDLVKSLKGFSFENFDMKGFPYFKEAIEIMANEIKSSIIDNKMKTSIILTLWMFFITP